jgi:hypothetical protein
MINRSVLILKPAEPYVEWARSLAREEMPPLSQGDEVAWLVPTCDTEDEAEEVLQEVWEDLFENELAAWDEDESSWPPDRSYEMFRAWFDVRWHSMVVDLCEGEITTEWEPDDEADEEE